jgi:regulator of protease activity HflC (stomatin/prohibitin superfamily)
MTGIQRHISALLFVGMGGCASVGPGQLGVLWSTRGGTQPQAYREGRHAIGAGDRMYLYDVRSLSRDEAISGLACSGLSVKIAATVRYHVVASEVVALQEQVGQAYYDKLVRPLFGSEARRVLARYAPEEIYATKRAAIEAEITAGMAARLATCHVVIEGVLLRDVELPLTLRAAIDKTAVTAQSLNDQPYMLSLAKSANERRQVEAQSTADYNRTVKPGLTREVLEHERIERVGKLATTPGNKVVVIDSAAAPTQITTPSP